MKLRSLLLALLFVFPGMLSAQNTPEITFTGYPLFAKAITPSDTVLLTDYNGKQVAQYVYVGGAGNVVCLPAGNPPGSTVTFLAVLAGTFVPVACQRVNVTGTTATGLIGIF